jgi:hypothetical protein
MTPKLSILLQAVRPRTILWVGMSERAEIDRSTADCADAVVTAHDPGKPVPPDLGRFDIAIVADGIDRLPVSDCTRMLANLRNLHTNVVAVAAPETPVGWTERDFLALGFAPAPGEGARLYVYDIATYNPRRDWNNPRHWANPENFGKYRW